MGVTNYTYASVGLLYPRSDNCKVGLYCDTNSTICIQQRAIGARCTADKECVSYNCLPNQTCGVDPSNPRHFPVWVYIIIGFGIFGGEHRCLASYIFAHNDISFSQGMIATLVFLFIVHGRQREDEREKRLQYWREQVKIWLFEARTRTYYFTCLQNAFRQNIMQMHETARNSLFTAPGSVSRRSALFGTTTTTEDGNTPMLDHAVPASKSSGLRHYVSEDNDPYEGGSLSDNEQLVMRTPYTHDNRI
jgi:hypothetical protein